jgi:two-component system CheB/CheR fusion protein
MPMAAPPSAPPERPASADDELVQPAAALAGQDAPAPAAFPIVGLGASAGGLKALTQLLAELPTDIGMGLVVIQHLDPHHGSQLAALLASQCRLPVADAADGAEIRPNHVYVISPNSRLTVDRGILQVSPRASGAGAHHPIDAFLQSLAADRPHRAIGVILSGTGTDGTLGLAAIKAARGITFAQDGTADYQGMPESAIGRGYADYVLPPPDIARELVKVARFGFPAMPEASIESAADDADESGVDAASAEDPERYAAIMGILQAATGIDFTHYRSSTIMRRTRRRMSMVAKGSLADYAAFLADKPLEVGALAKDILIHVTSFFRDHAAFAALKQHMFPGVTERSDPESTIRIWVVGCSTGQEVYSLAMQLVDHCRSLAVSPHIQIFATDISDWALNKARLGSYPETIIKEVPGDLLGRYFTKEESGYRVTKLIRDMCVFAKHDVTSDTPFSRIDLISCRNVLIYLGAALQKYVLPTFHFALKPGGYLLLGSSETLGRASNLFATIDEGSRLYRSLASAVRVRPPSPRQRPVDPGTPRSPLPQQAAGSDMQRAADQIVLGRFAPPGVLINGAMDVVQFRGRTHPFLEPAPGEPSRNLLTMVPFGVSQALREAIAEAKRRDCPVRRERVAHRREEAFRDIAFEVIPITLPDAEGGYLILFADQGREPQAPLRDAPPGPAPGMPEGAGQGSEAGQLRGELAAATDYIHSLLGINTALIDRMKEAEEEAQSSTEEYRSTNEELQTAKEEVESTNEELVTINEELRYTSAEREKAAAALGESSQLMTAIFATMRYPLLVLDDQLRVDTVNAAFLETFAVDRAQTIGRLVYDLGDGQWNIPELRRLLEDILPNNSAFDDFEVVHDFPGRGPMTMLLNARRLHSGPAGSPRIVLVIADTTERSRSALALLDISADQLRSNGELAHFAAVAAHDLQEPLRMVTSYVELLGHQYAPLFDERAKRFMAYATDGARRMGEMINAILAYSQLGHETTGMVAFDSGLAIIDALDNLSVKIGEAQATITLDAMPRILASRGQLTQLFQNLIGNAVKYHSPERPPAIHIGSWEDALEWTFSIADNGIGMQEEDYQKIFLPFHRKETDRFVRGCGIGLATCKRIVEHHRGRIWVTSRMDIGSTFVFTVRK